MRNRRVSKAFTLVEILIVVVILGILAAIVVPQFTSASEEAQLSNLQSQLQTIRNQIELYRVRNNGTPPLLADLFVEGAAGLVGPDFLRAAPVNPRTGTTTAEAGDEDSAVFVESGDTAWFYDEDTGGFWANGYNEVDGTWIPAP